MRHKKWFDVVVFLDKIIDNLGSSIFDKRCKKIWDAGQAICAEAYGPNWMENETFIEWDQKEDPELPEPYFYECAEKMANGYIPEWVGE